MNEIKLKEVNELTTDEVLDAFYQLEALKEQIDIYKAKLLPIMRKYYEETGQKTVENDYVRISYKKAYPAKKFQTALFQKAEPELYEEYCNTDMVKESVIVKVKE